MKKQLIDLIIILIALLLIFFKDLSVYRFNQIKTIESVIDYDLKNTLDDYKSLKQEFNIKTLDYKCITRIKERNINDYYKYITIYNNHNCNLKKKDLVLSNNELLGFVVNVNQLFAKVILITNPKSSVSVKVNNNYGTLKSSHGKSYIEDLIFDNDLKIGDRVYTSGLTDIPKDIYIGEISKIDDFKVELNVLSINSDNPYVSIIGD